MKKIRKSLELLSPEIILSIASYIVTFSLLLTGIHIFCRQQRPSFDAKNVKKALHRFGRILQKIS